MSRLFIDIETYSSKDLGKCGVYTYAAAPDFDVTLIGFAFDDGDVQVLDTEKRTEYVFKSSDTPDMFGEESAVSNGFFEALKRRLIDPKVEKVAHNASFEMACLERYFNITLDPAQWTDTMALASIAGLPASLGALSDVLKLGEKGKKSIGRQLITEFAQPDKKTGLRKRSDDDPARWAEYIKYNRYDVEAERRIYELLSDFTAGTFQTDKPVYCMDYTINRRGIRADVELARSAVKLSQEITAPLQARLKEITGLSNPNSTPALKQWLNNTKDKEVGSLTKNKTAELIEQTDDAEIKEVLTIKTRLAKVSAKKYDAVLRTVGDDGRVRGAFRYYGAARTGRWAGRLVQLQNLRRNSIPDLGIARELVKARELELLEMAYDIPGLDSSEVLGQLVRTALIPSEGRKLIIADFSAIEARVIAWLANEKWRQEVFSHDGDIYKSSYNQAFGVPIEKVTKEQRQKGKIMELALGYGGAVGALKAFGADKLGMSDNELRGLVSRWRATSPNITGLWRKCENCAIEAIEDGMENTIQINGDLGISFSRVWLLNNPVLLIRLPTGRSLYYQNAVLSKGETGATQITYMDVGAVSRNYERVTTHGGKLVENITQAVARDCLANAMLKLESQGYEIVAHVHDEVIIDAPISAKVGDVTQIMGEPWERCKGLHLTAHGYEGSYYFKD